MAQYSVPNNGSINQYGFNIKSDRLISINPSATIVIYDSNNNVIATILGSDAEVSIQIG